MRLLVALGLAGLVCAQGPAAQDYGYEVASIKKADPTARGTRIGPGPQGGMRTTNTTLLTLITFVYNVQEYQVADVTPWVKSEAFDVSFTPDKPDAMPAPGSKVEVVESFIARNRLRMKAVLRDRFGLVLREETRQMPVYGLVVAKGGHKLKTPDEAKKGPSMSTNGERGQITGYGVNMGMLTRALAGFLKRPVTDETGFNVPFDMKLEFKPDALAAGLKEESTASDLEGASIFTAVQEQLGLKLESKKGPVTVCVIEKAERPGEN